MAEKKFFVDINLQGSALKNAKIGTNSDGFPNARNGEPEISKNRRI